MNLPLLLMYMLWDRSIAKILRVGKHPLVRLPGSILLPPLSGHVTLGKLSPLYPSFLIYEKAEEECPSVLFRVINTTCCNSLLHVRTINVYVLLTSHSDGHREVLLGFPSSDWT